MCMIVLLTCHLLKLQCLVGYYNCTNVKPFIISLACIETDIDLFLSFYRDSFPHATVTPKLHMLEDHVVPFLQEFGVGIGCVDRVLGGAGSGVDSQPLQLDTQKGTLPVFGIVL